MAMSHLKFPKSESGVPKLTRPEDFQTWKASLSRFLKVVTAERVSLYDVVYGGVVPLSHAEAPVRCVNPPAAAIVAAGAEAVGVAAVNVGAGAEPINHPVVVLPPGTDANQAENIVNMVQNDVNAVIALANAQLHAAAVALPVGIELAPVQIGYHYVANPPHGNPVIPNVNAPAPQSYPGNPALPAQPGAVIPIPPGNIPLPHSDYLTYEHRDNRGRRVLDDVTFGILEANTMNLIVSTLSPANELLVRPIRQASEMVEQLRLAYEEPARNRKFALLNEFNAIKQRAGEDFTAYLTRFQTTMNEINLIAGYQQITSEDAGVKLIHSVDQVRYAQIISQRASTSDYNFQGCITALRDFEAYLRRNENEAKVTEAATVATTLLTNDKNRNKHCEYCNGTSHRSNKCWKKFPDLRPTRRTGNRGGNHPYNNSSSGASTTSASGSATSSVIGGNSGSGSVSGSGTGTRGGGAANAATNRNINNRNRVNNRYNNHGSNAEVLVTLHTSESESLAHSTALMTDSNSREFVVDTGSSIHLTGDKSLLHDYVEIENKSISTINSTTSMAVGMGDIVLQLVGSTTRTIISSVYYCPKLPYNIISVGALIRNNCHLNTTEGKITITSPGGSVFECVNKNNIFTSIINVVPVVQPEQVLTNSDQRTSEPADPVATGPSDTTVDTSTNSDTNQHADVPNDSSNDRDKTSFNEQLVECSVSKLHQYHCIMGHTSLAAFLEAVKDGKLLGAPKLQVLEKDKDKLKRCDACYASKFVSEAHKDPATRCDSPFDLIHIDISEKHW